MPCVHEFGLLKEYKKDEIYNKYEPNIAENIVEIEDDLVNLWYFETQNMVCYTENVTKLSKGLNMYGITIIPPSSLHRFAEIVENRTSKERFDEVCDLIKLITSAIKQDKYIIHFGV